MSRRAAAVRLQGKCQQSLMEAKGPRKSAAASGDNRQGFDTAVMKH